MSFFKSSRSNLLSPDPSQIETLASLAALQSAEGRLAIDVYKIEGAFVVRSTIAGAKIDDLEIIVDNQLLIIKGRRQEPELVDYLDYLHRECYWGNFSRTVSLPALINEDQIEAELDEGVLTIVLPIKDPS